MANYSAVRKDDFVTCPHCQYTRISSGSANVIIEGKSAARLNDICNCGGTVTNSSDDYSVFINGIPAAYCPVHATKDHEPVSGATSVFINGKKNSEKSGLLVIIRFLHPGMIYPLCLIADLLLHLRCTIRKII